MPAQNHSTLGKSVKKKPGKSKTTNNVELWAGGGLHGPGKTGWSDDGKEKYPRNVKTSSEVKQQQQPASEKPPGGSPKQVRVLLSLQKSPKNIKRNLHKGKNN